MCDQVYRSIAQVDLRHVTLVTTALLCMVYIDAEMTEGQSFPHHQVYKRIKSHQRSSSGGKDTAKMKFLIDFHHPSVAFISDKSSLSGKHWCVYIKVSLSLCFLVIYSSGNEGRFNFTFFFIIEVCIAWLSSSSSISEVFPNIVILNALLFECWKRAIAIFFKHR